MRLNDTLKYLAFLIYIVVVYTVLFFVLRPPIDVRMQQAMKDNPPQYMNATEQSEESSEIARMMNDYPAASIDAFGTFIAGAHPGAGMAKLVTHQGKRKLIFSEDFATDAGPNLHVFLSGSSAPASSKELHANGDVDLGPLKDVTGPQMYDIPEGLDFEPQSVVVYCVPFKVIFTSASLQ